MISSNYSARDVTLQRFPTTLQSTPYTPTPSMPIPAPPNLFALPLPPKSFQACLPSPSKTGASVVGFY